jgi:hypothetical protein
MVRETHLVPKLRLGNEKKGNMRRRDACATSFLPHFWTRNKLKAYR